MMDIININNYTTRYLSSMESEHEIGSKQYHERTRPVGRPKLRYNDTCKVR